MRRRRGDPVEHVPPELWTFDPARWRPLVVEEPPPGRVDVAWWRDRAALDVWADARRRWAATHGWPTDTIEQLREQLAARRALRARRGERR